ncbi:dihydrolipoamide acetyltransferase family protein [Nocardioides jiangxiensis]|uniref:Dihydrolipoamide acetyltransferase component of pyruvate dehydrogenase complex n=1 Tax=Nocardioides jiangxiensis TaxID=3064524 RepID=A0ABT9B153_9ACTN|nr:dihydrolipoamide acetyltransferase family protein [Nocardioides sp. WY-20]MDO7868403.1 dihydrolipoamide acetyltransferase family protein [Nocardioides sp. WY-20]
MADYLLPDVGEGLTEAEIVSWHVAVGDTVTVNQVLLEIETAKSVVELPSPFAGEVHELLVEVGQTVTVGTPLIRIGDPGAPAGAAPAHTADVVASTGEVGADLGTESDGPRTLVGYGPRETVSRRRRGGPVQGGVLAPGHRAPMAPASPAARPLAPPPVRLRARELGIDLNQVRASRADGVISLADLTAAATSAPAPELPPLKDREYREPVKGVRRLMAQAMVDSAFSAPHVTLTVEIDTTHAVDLVRELRTDPRYAGIRVTALLLIARACILALRDHPELNARWDGEAVTFRRYVNLGIAAATPRGLIVPNIKDAADLNGPELARAIEALTEISREGKAQPADQTGGTFTITNIGVLKVDSGTPIINPGESAILAVGAIRRKPWVITTRDGSEAIAIRDVVTFSLSVDHRFIDGATASMFLARIAAYSQDPSGLGL